MTRGCAREEFQVCLCVDDTEYHEHVKLYLGIDGLKSLDPWASFPVDVVVQRLTMTHGRSDCHLLGTASSRFVQQLRLDL